MKKNPKNYSILAFLVLVGTLLFAIFTCTGQKANAQSFEFSTPAEKKKTEEKKGTQTRHTYKQWLDLKKNNKTKVNTPPPILPGYGSSPTLQGTTNGTIGPPGGDATAIMGVPTAGTVRVNNLLNLERLLVACLFFISIATCAFVMFRRNKSKKNSLWVNSAVAALILMVAGFLMGNLFNFNSKYNDSIISYFDR